MPSKFTMPDGSIQFVDDNGNIIHTSKIEKDLSGQSFYTTPEGKREFIPGSTQPSLSAGGISQAPSFTQSLVRPLYSGAGQGMGATAGALYGAPLGPGGALAGAVVGGLTGGTGMSLLAQGLQAKYPGIFGPAPANNFTEAVNLSLKDAAENALWDAAGFGVGKLGKALFKKLEDTAFKTLSKSVPYDTGTLQNVSEAVTQLGLKKPRVSNLTSESRLIPSAERILGKGSLVGDTVQMKKDSIREYKRQLGEISKWQIEPGMASSESAKKIGEKIIAEKEIVHNAEKQAHRFFTDNFVDQAKYTAEYAPPVSQVKPVINPFTGLATPPKPQANVQTVIPGPIIVDDLRNILPVASAQLDELSKVIESTGAPVDAVRMNIAILKDNLNKFMAVQPDLKSGHYLIPYDLSKMTREVLSNGPLKNIPHDRGGKILEQLRDGLSRAEDFSVGNPVLGWKPDAGDAMHLAKSKTQERVTKYGSDLIEKFATEPNNPVYSQSLEINRERLLSQGIRTAEDATKLIAAMGGNKDLAAGEFFDRVFSGATTDDGFDFKKLYDGFYGKGASGATEVLLNRQEQQNLKRLVDYIRVANIPKSEALVGTALIRGGMAVIGLPAGLYTFAKTGNVPASAAVVLAFPAAAKLARELVFNPGQVDRFLKLTKTRPNSAEAYFTTKSLLRGMAGTTGIMVRTINGYQPADIKSNGQVVIK